MSAINDKIISVDDSQNFWCLLGVYLDILLLLLLLLL